MDVVMWLIFGLVVGWLAGIIYKGSSLGVIGNIAIGILGSLVGGYLGSRFFNVEVTGFNIQSIVISVIGAIILLFIINIIKR